MVIGQCLDRPVVAVCFSLFISRVDVGAVGTGFEANCTMVPNIVWMLGTRARSTTKVKVTKGPATLVGQVGLVVRVGHVGDRQFYEVQFGTGRRGKKLVESGPCRVVMVDGERMDWGSGEECDSGNGTGGGMVSCCSCDAVCQSYTPVG